MLYFILIYNKINSITKCCATFIIQNMYYYSEKRVLFVKIFFSQFLLEKILFCFLIVYVFIYIICIYFNEKWKELTKISYRIKIECYFFHRVKYNDSQLNILTLIIKDWKQKFKTEKPRFSRITKSVSDHTRCKP